MHRSGTSVTSRLLNLLGVYLGPPPHLMEAHPDDNPKGYWEHQPLTDLNDALLARLGGTWQDPPRFPEGWESGPALADLRERARALVEQDFSAHPLWGWKDPRTCLTVPFWRHVLGPMRYVLCFRNPLDVTRSLARRYGAFDTGIPLWLTYVRSALEHTTGQPRVFVFYEDLMTQADEELRRLASLLGTPERAEDPAVRAAAREFIEQELHHHRTSIVDFVAGPEVTFPAKALYVILRASARRAEAEGAADAVSEMPDVLSLLSGQATDAQALAASIGKAEKRVAELTAERDRVAAEEAGLRAALHERDRALQAATGQLTAERDRSAAERDGLAAERDRIAGELAAEREALIAERETRAAERDQVRVERDRLAAERDRVAEEGRRALEQKGLVTAERNRLAEEGRRTLERANALATERDRLAAEARLSLEKLGRLAAERDRLAEEGRRFVVQTAQLAAERDGLSAQAQRSAEHILRVEAERDWWAGEARQLRAMLEHRDGVLADIHSSRLWRVLGLYRRFMLALLPPGSRRRGLYRAIVGGSSNGPRS
jgi:hypothetical protein